MSTWQPIETAPKDGVRFLAWQDIYGCYTAQWRERWGWIDAQAIDECGDFIEREPTRWMPLPEPPERP